jgi:hypothetical protein
MRCIIVINSIDGCNWRKKGSWVKVGRWFADRIGEKNAEVI